MNFFVVIQVVLLLAAGMQTVSAESLQQEIAVIADAADEHGVITGKEGWLFLQEELEHLGSTGFSGEEVKKSSRAAKAEFADPLPAIIDFNDQLTKLGIELIFVPVPPKALIYSDKLPGNIAEENRVALDHSYTKIYAELTRNGVQVLDLIPYFQDARKKEQVYCKTDTHFSGSGLAVAGERLGQILKEKDWTKSVPKKKFSTETRLVEINGDLSSMQKSDRKESLTLQFVTDFATGKPVQPDLDSPVLLLGDSHTLVFSVGGDMHSNGAGLFDKLSAELEFPVDLIGVRGSGATPSRIKLYQRARKDSSFIKQKKIVVWCLSSRELTGSGGWRKIPVEKK